MIEVDWARLKAHELRKLANENAVVILPIAYCLNRTTWATSARNDRYSVGTGNCSPCGAKGI